MEGGILLISLSQGYLLDNLLPSLHIRVTWKLNHDQAHNSLLPQLEMSIHILDYMWKFRSVAALSVPEFRSEDKAGQAISDYSTRIRYLAQIQSLGTSKIPMLAKCQIHYHAHTLHVFFFLWSSKQGEDRALPVDKWQPHTITESFNRASRNPRGLVPPLTFSICGC